MTDVKSQNVYNKPLYIHTTPTPQNPTGYCRADPTISPENTSIAATLTRQFLDFSTARGHPLPDLSPGQKACLGAARWKEAFEARRDDDDPVVPRVSLHATGVRALEDVGLKELKRCRAEGEGSNPGKEAVDVSKMGPGSKFRESGDVGGVEPRA